MSTLDSICEHCGKPLEEYEIPFGNTAIKLFRECECYGAQEARRRREAEEAERQRREEEERVIRSYKFAGLPRRYWDAEADDAEFVSAIKEGRGLFFTGKSGRGKTYMACSIARKLIAERWRVKFADVESIEREVTSTWNSRGENEESVISKYVNADLAIIDDLGAEELTAVTMKVLRAVISGREANAAVTIFTSNYSRLEFAKHIAQEADRVMAARLASRIAGMSEVFEFTGEDRRLTR